MAASHGSDTGRIFREEYGRAVSVLARVFGDIGIAEDAVQDAFTAAAQRWPSAGLPPSPAGWIITTARNRAIDRLRREASRGDLHAQAALLYSPDTPAEEGLVRADLCAEAIRLGRVVLQAARPHGVTGMIRAAHDEGPQRPELRLG